MPSAPAVLLAAGEQGVRLSTSGGFIDWQAERAPPQELLAAIAAVKTELIQILQGTRCRWCGGTLTWVFPAGVVLADGLAERHPCAEAEAWRSPRAMHSCCR